MTGSNPCSVMPVCRTEQRADAESLAERCCDPGLADLQHFGSGASGRGAGGSAIEAALPPVSRLRRGSDHTQQGRCYGARVRGVSQRRAEARDFRPLELAGKQRPEHEGISLVGPAKLARAG